jgi:hypothetical protein
MGASYTRQSTYTTGDTIQAADTNDEFDQLLAAFNATSGHTHDGTTGEGGPITALISNTLTFGAGSAGTDITITFDGETNDGVMKWMEDEDYFEFPDDILMSSTEKLQFRDTAIYLNSSTDGQLDIVADTLVQVASAAFTVDASGDITLDAGGADVILKDDGTQYASFTNSSGDLVIKSGSTTAMTFSGANVTFAGTVTIGSAGISEAELEILDGATVTTTELNIMDGDTSASSTTIVDADRIVLNDDGTMKQVAVTDLAAYLDDEITAMPNLVTTAATTVGALDSGSITSGFGNIDTGSSTITTTGLISGGSLDIDDVLINGATIGHTDDTDLLTLANGIVTVAGEISVTTLDIGGTNVTATATELNLLDGVSGLVQADFTKLAAVDATATELNIMDGDTSASSITLVDADRVVINDNGTMAQVALSALATYMEGAIDTGANITTVGALNAGSITSGFGNIDNGASNITSGGLLKLDVDADADDLTGDSATGRLTIGAGEDLNLYHGGTNSYIVNDTGDLIIDTEGDVVLDANGADVLLKDNGTQYGALTNSSGNLIIKSGSTTALTFSGADVTIAGDLTVSGDDITMGTNTSGNLLIADGTNFNSVAVGSLSEISSVANDDVFLAVDTSGGGLKKITRSTIISGLAVSGAAISNVVEDTTPQLGGDLDVNGNGIVSVSNGNIALTPNGTGVVRIDGNVDIQSGTIDLKNSGSRSKINFYCESGNAHAQALQAAPHSESASNTLTLPSTGGDVDLVSTASTATLTNKTFGDNTSFGDNNITNVGDIALDSISADGTDINVAVSDNSATAFTIKQGSDAYLIVDTANSSESVAIGTGISGTSISLGHSTSTVTVNDNLVVTGDLTVNGDTTTIATTNLTVSDHLIKLGQGYTGSANDQGVIITRGDGSSSNTANKGFIWDESADEFATVAANTEAGTTTGNVTINDYANLHVGGLTADDTITFGSLVGSAGGATITGVLDEDNFSSDSDTKLATQQSIKAYVDSEISGSGSMSNWVLEDDDGTEVTVSNAKEVKFIGSGITTNFTDTDNGTNADPYDLTFTVDAAQTGITSVTNTSLVVGRDADNQIKFGTDNEITFRVGAGDGVVFKASGEIEATSLDIGSGGADIDGTLTATNLAGTLTTAAQTNITSLGTLTTLTVDDITINGSTISDGGDFTLDIDGDITIDANGGTITFSDNGSSLGTITSSGYSGNAATATKFASTVTINGTAFDGSGNIVLGNGSVTHVMLGGDAVDGDNIADDSINSEHYVDGSIDTAHIADDQVTYAKIQNVSATNRILGRDSSGAGIIEEISPSSLRTMINVEDGATANSAGSGISISSGEISHSDTSSQSSSNNSGRTYIQDITLDTYGHVTGLATATETVTDTNTTYSAGSGLSLSGTTFSHSDTSSQSSVDNSGSTFIQDITLDTYGHITGINSATVSASGTQAANDVSTGNRNVAGGTTALDSIQSGADDNTCFGYDAGTALTTGDKNVFIGAYAGAAEDAGGGSVFIGYKAGRQQAAHYILDYGHNIGIGIQAGEYMGVGHSSIFIGYQAGQASSSNPHTCVTTIGIGHQSCTSKNSGEGNTFIGAYAGDNGQSGDYNSVFGYDADCSSTNVSNQLTLGASNVTSLRCQQTSISSLSDRRDKSEIVDSPYGLDFINSVRPVQFKWKRRRLTSREMRDEYKDPYKDLVRVGFIAQELQSAMESVGENTNDILDLVFDDNPDRLEAKQGNMLPIAIKAIQELSAKVDALTKRVEALE